MFKKLKQRYYFLFAGYFKFWARLRLKRWRPYLIVITASNGKTTLLHLLQSQVGERARYSHLANSAFGIPFHILDISRQSFGLLEWPALFIRAPLALLTPLPKEKIYIVEADCDRPDEGKFLADLLSPDMTLWLNVSRTHTENFASQLKSGEFTSIEAAVSHEFGYFLAKTKQKAYINGDSKLIKAEVSRSQAQIESYQEKIWLNKYEISTNGTRFLINNRKHSFTGSLLPKDTWLSLAMCLSVCLELDLAYDYNYQNFTLPPGRSSVFAGIKNTTLIDSSYNANYDSVRAMLELFASLKADSKWVVLGDMIELGQQEAEEHQKLGKLLAQEKFDKIILIGPRLQKHTVPLLDQTKTITFLEPKEALAHIRDTLKGGETIFFKGSRFLEGIIEQLLLDQTDAKQLCRREKVWQKRRRHWGLG